MSRMYLTPRERMAKRMADLAKQLRENQERPLPGQREAQRAAERIGPSENQRAMYGRKGE